MCGANPREGRDYIVAAPHFNEGQRPLRAVWPQPAPLVGAEAQQWRRIDGVRALTHLKQQPRGAVGARA